MTAFPSFRTLIAARSFVCVAATESATAVLQGGILNIVNIVRDGQACALGDPRHTDRVSRPDEMTKVARTPGTMETMYYVNSREGFWNLIESSPDPTVTKPPYGFRSSRKIHHRLRNELNMAFTAVAVRRYEPAIQKIAQGIYTSASPDTLQIAALGYSMDDLGEEYVAATTEILVVRSIQTAGQILTDAIGVYLPKWLVRAAVSLPTKTFKAVRKAIRLAKK
ncbi:hypothetical protein DFH08DRAFT_803305 [Mycena albidolilacea]|uniref:Uncharacterized protein n=1 Tax=Mycena albidolilacea TaxID=1033008 RepID=A0AAD7ADK5_9AGAR|nr:hypothetical protein DFH08DRAFT_803305 [Mycena albidolilacea]